MEMKEKVVSVSVTGETIAQNLLTLATSIDKALADGFQPMQDVPAIIMENLHAMIASVAVLKQAPADVKEDALEFAKPLNLVGYDIAKVFMK